MEFPIDKKLFHLVVNPGTWRCPTVVLELVQTTRNVNGTRDSVRKFQPGKRAHLFRFSTFLGIFQWNEPTKRVPFTALCFKVRCFVFEKHRKFYLSSKIFFIFFTLKHGKFRLQRWNCSKRASKSRGNTATEGWKRTGTFPLTFTFADKHIGCYGNGLIEFGACSIWIVEDVGRGSFLFPTYLGRSKETLFAGLGIAWRCVQKCDRLEARSITVTYHIKAFSLFAIDWFCSKY